MTRVFLGIGSNLGNRENNLRNAIERLGSSSFVVKEISSFYETEPVGPVREQPPFLNCIVAADYASSAQSLLALALDVENEMGRERSVPMGPRTIDLDILYYGNDVIDDSPELRIPHPGIAGRRFVLIPMNEVDPDWQHPKLGKTQSELLNETADTSAVVVWKGGSDVWDTGI